MPVGDSINVESRRLFTAARINYKCRNQINNNNYFIDE